MTPQERQMLGELFERLASLENAPRDSEALAAVNDGLRRAPNALYPLVQTVLVQDEALKRADARIRELEDELGNAPAQPQGQGGFLDNMRNTLLGQRERQGPGQGSVPSVRPDAEAHRSSVWSSSAVQPAGYAPAQQSGPAGGSFLGTAATTAAGVMGGSMLMHSLRGLFGGHAGMGQGQGTGHSAFNPGGGQPGAPGGQSSGGDLSKQAGIDDIGNSAGGGGGGESGQRAGLFDTAQNNSDTSGDDPDDTDFDDDNDFDDGGDDTA